MFRNIKKNLFFSRFNLLFQKGINDGKISEFDDEIFDKMSNTYIACLPVSMRIKHSNHMFAQGTCYERSLYMFLALDDAYLVRGDDKVLEYKYGKGHEGHGWVEVGDVVYDPSLMLKFDKDTYYNLYGITNTKKCDKKTYLERHSDFVEQHVSHDINDFRPGGKRRLELGVLIIQLRCLSEMLGDCEFTTDLNKYLESISYDEKQICDERNKVIQKILRDEQAMARISGNA